VLTLYKRPFEKTIRTSNESDDELGVLRQDEQTPDSRPAAASHELSTRRSLRKHTGGLRLREQLASKSPEARRLNVDGKIFSQRRKKQHDVQKMEPSGVQKLLRGIWDQIYGNLSFDLRHVVSTLNALLLRTLSPNYEPHLILRVD
jgi:hypothetical protein